jgi:hypothetical protein
MRRPAVLLRALPAALVALGLSGCKERDAFGYVEVRKAVSSSTDTFKVNAVALAELPRKGVAVVRQPVGPAKLEVIRGERTYLLCAFDVGKNRIVTVTLSASEGQLRCTVQN